MNCHEISYMHMAQVEYLSNPTLVRVRNVSDYKDIE